MQKNVEPDYHDCGLQEFVGIQQNIVAGGQTTKTTALPHGLRLRGLGSGAWSKDQQGCCSGSPMELLQRHRTE